MPLLPPDQTHYGETGDANNIYALATQANIQPALFPYPLPVSPTTLTSGVVVVYTDPVSRPINTYWRVTAQILLTVVSGTAGANDQVEILTYFGAVGAAPFRPNTTRGGQSVTPVIPVPAPGGGYSTGSIALCCIVPALTASALSISGFPASGNGATYGMTVQSLVLEQVA
jgi:hypothetical protein